MRRRSRRIPFLRINLTFCHHEAAPRPKDLLLFLTDNRQLTTDNRLHPLLRFACTESGAPPLSASFADRVGIRPRCQQTPHPRCPQSHNVGRQKKAHGFSRGKACLENRESVLTDGTTARGLQSERHCRAAQKQRLHQALALFTERNSAPRTRRRPSRLDQLTSAD